MISALIEEVGDEEGRGAEEDRRAEERLPVALVDVRYQTHCIHLKQKN